MTAAMGPGSHTVEIMFPSPAQETIMALLRPDGTPVVQTSAAWQYEWAQYNQPASIPLSIALAQSLALGLPESPTYAFTLMHSTMDLPLSLDPTAATMCGADGALRLLAGTPSVFTMPFDSSSSYAASGFAPMMVAGSGSAVDCGGSLSVSPSGSTFRLVPIPRGGYILCMPDGTCATYDEGTDAVVMGTNEPTVWKAQVRAGRRPGCGAAASPFSPFL